MAVVQVMRRVSRCECAVVKMRQQVSGSSLGSVARGLPNAASLCTLLSPDGALAHILQAGCLPARTRPRGDSRLDSRRQMVA
jgi:hypothetical protein